jgi:nicotinamide phosphoribosyltransferase
MSKAAITPRLTTASPIAALLDCDGYKQGHIRVWAQANPNPLPTLERDPSDINRRPANGDNSGTTRVLINWTNRSNEYLPESSHAVVFGVQAFAQEYLTEAWAPFFAADVDEVCALFEEELLAYFGPNSIGSDHFRELHALGYLPLKVSALPEGTLAPIGVATLTIENTHDAFFWLPNYIETALSASIWHPGTTATIALEYRELMEEWAAKTGGDLASIDFQAHDFSMRGQTSIQSAAVSGAGHLLSFLGSDSMPSIKWIRRYYPGANNGLIAASVPATEHSVMTVRGEAGELETFHRVLDAFPTGIVSAVADGYDFFKVITKTLMDPGLYARIMSRDGKLVIRPDSGNPVDIICGTRQPRLLEDSSGQTYEYWPTEDEMTPEELGTVRILARNFGTTTNAMGYKEFDSHIGVIYGDAITKDRARSIFELLAEMGFVSTNVVLGLGSFNYQYRTRDSLGSAVKATHAIVDGFSVDIQKDPKTGGGGKKSAKGLIALFRDEMGEIVQVDEATPEQVTASLLQPVWENGYFLVHQSFGDIRVTLKSERAARAARKAKALATS